MDVNGKVILKTNCYPMSFDLKIPDLSNIGKCLNTPVDPRDQRVSGTSSGPSDFEVQVTMLEPNNWFRDQIMNALAQVLKMSFNLTFQLNCWLVYSNFNG